MRVLYIRELQHDNVVCDELHFLRIQKGLQVVYLVGLYLIHENRVAILIYIKAAAQIQMAVS